MYVFVVQITTEKFKTFESLCFTTLVSTILNTEFHRIGSILGFALIFTSSYNHYLKTVFDMNF